MSYRHANYSGYPEYDQGTKVFDHHTSLLDTLFNCGPATRKHLKSLRDRSAFSIPAEAQHRAYVFDPMARDCSALGGVDLIGGRVGNDDRVHADSLLPGAVDCSKHF